MVSGLLMLVLLGVLYALWTMPAFRVDVAEISGLQRTPRSRWQSTLSRHEDAATWNGGQPLRVDVAEDDAVLAEGIKIGSLRCRHVWKRRLFATVRPNVILPQAIDHKDNKVHPVTSSVHWPQHCFGDGTPSYRLPKNGP